MDKCGFEPQNNPLGNTRKEKELDHFSIRLVKYQTAANFLYFIS